MTMLLFYSKRVHIPYMEIKLRSVGFPGFRGFARTVLINN